LAEAFDRAHFSARLRTGALGRRLLVRDTTASTNDDAWAALAELGDGVAVVALAQERGRGRAGRAWAHVPGRGLALSVALRLGCDARQAGAIPLAAGLAVARAAHALGVAAARLKWPNDVLVEGRKLAGILCELKRGVPAGGGRGGGDAVVIGVGLNVRHAREDFPEELRERATSLALEGSDASLEEAAAETLSQLEPVWRELQEGDRGALLAEWSRWCPSWGERLRVRTPAGEIAGTALRLDPDGALVLREDSGREVAVAAGDVETGRGRDAA
jgi:BirA family biotin operon repressor/biotin-[acetyl-CoA-carboxylase] ligase